MVFQTLRNSRDFNAGLANRLCGYEEYQLGRAETVEQAPMLQAKSPGKTSP